MRDGTGEKLACPSCGHLRSRVLPDHLGRAMDAYKRHRQCAKCLCVFRTEERIAAVIRPAVIYISSAK